MKNPKTKLALAFVCITSALCAQLQTPLVNPTDTLAAKQKTKVREYGIGFTNLNSYSLQYRWGSPKVLYRINANVGFTGLSNSNSNSASYANTGFGSSSTDVQTKTPATLNAAVGFSVLTLKQINSKFGVILGGTAGLTYSTSAVQTTQTNANQDNNGNISTQTYTTKTNSITIQPSIGFVLGMFYKITPSFIIYAEIAPNVYYAASRTNSTTTDLSQSIGINYESANRYTNSANLGLSGFSNSGAMLTLVYRITKNKK